MLFGFAFSLASSANYRILFPIPIPVLRVVPKSEKVPEPEEDKESTNPVGFLAELKRRKVFRVAITYTVVAWLIIQIASATFGWFEIPAWAFRFVTIVLILGFPIAVIITWAFELTPSGIKLTKSLGEEERKAATAAHEKKRNWTALGFAAGLPTLIFGTLALYFFFQSSGSSDDAAEANSNVPEAAMAEVAALDKSIAVLPFDNRSNVEEDQFFTDGIHDDLLTYISRIRDIKTISRTSVMPFKNVERNLTQIGEELDVSYIMEGGVQRAGNHIRINVQLIDAETDSHVWAEIYTREMSVENVFAIQTEITESIVEELKAVISPEEQDSIHKLPTQNLAALEAYFKGNATWSTGGIRIAEGIEHYKRAVELDPEFAVAMVAQASAYIAQIFYEGLPVEEQSVLAQPLIDRALEIDPNLGSAYSAQATIYHHRDDDRKAMEAAFKKALELSPNDSTIYSAYGSRLTWMGGRHQEGIALLKKSLELSPNNPNAFREIGTGYLNFGDLENAEVYYLKTLELEKSGSNYRALGDLYGYGLRQYDLSIYNLRKSLELDPQTPQTANWLGDYSSGLGLKDDAAFWYQRAIDMAPEGAEVKRYRLKLSEHADDEETFQKTCAEILQADPIREIKRELRRKLARSYARSGDYEKAFEQLSVFRRENGVSNSKPGGGYLEANILFATFIVLTGRDEQYQGYLNAIDDYRAEFPAKGISYKSLNGTEALFYAATGERNKMINALRVFQEAGGVTLLSDWLKYPWFAAYQNDPEFIEIKQVFDAELERQRQNLREMEVNGELAPIPEL